MTKTVLKVTKYIIPSALILLAAFAAACSSNTKTEEETDTIIAVDSISVDSGVAVVDSAEVAVKENAPAPRRHPSRYIVVDKPKLKLYVVENNDTLFKGPITCGRYFGQKRSKDDRRTPEGEFHITHIHDASGWLYEGRIPHVYGPWFLRLSANGWQGIGIHGTNAPGQISRRVSKGCIRMLNQDIVKVKALAEEGMKVIVVADNKQSISGVPKTNIAEKEHKESQSIVNEGEAVEVQQPDEVPAPAEETKEIIEIKQQEKPEPVKKDTIG